MENKEKQKIKEEGEEEEEEEEISKLVLGIMEGYSDSVIPPLSQFNPLFESSIVVAQEDISSSRKGTRTKPSSSAAAQGARAEYSNKEKDRRVKMNESFAILESLVPNLAPKVCQTPLK